MFRRLDYKIPCLICVIVMLYALVKDNDAQQPIRIDANKPLAPMVTIHLSHEQRQLWDEVNMFRERNGCGPLSPDPILCEVAQLRAPYFDHDVNGGPLKDVSAHGWLGDALAENLGLGYVDSHECVFGDPDGTKGWAHSHDGHREAMLRKDLNVIGMGVVNHKYCIIMGRIEPGEAAQQQNNWARIHGQD